MKHCCPWPIPWHCYSRSSDVTSGFYLLPLTLRHYYFTDISVCLKSVKYHEDCDLGSHCGMFMAWNAYITYTLSRECKGTFQGRMIYDFENLMISQLLWDFAEGIIWDKRLDIFFFFLDIPSFDLEKIWTGTMKCYSQTV